MKQINKEIAALFPFKTGLNSKLEKKPIKLGGNADVRMMKELLPSIGSVELPRRGSVGEKVFKLFSHPGIRYGSLSQLSQSKESLEGAINKQAKKEKPLVFHIAGFPHKMPNPFFTLNTRADLGELAFLWRLETTAQLISEVYKPGARIIVCLEGTVFHHLAMISKFEAQNYQEQVITLAKMFNLSRLEFIDLVDLHHLIPKWERVVRKKARSLERAFKRGNPLVVKQVERTWPVIFTTLNVRGWKPQEIRKLFQVAKDGPREEKRGRLKELVNFALFSTFDYLAYNQAKKESGLMEKAFPGAVKLTVVPKQNAFGIWWIKKGIEKLPYYGVPVVHKNKFWNIEYAFDAVRLYDLKRWFLPAFSDEPFFYEIKK